jgi:hypothetical protein
LLLVVVHVEFSSESLCTLSKADFNALILLLCHVLLLQGIHLQPGNIVPMRGHLVEDIEAYNVTSAAAAPAPAMQQQQQQQQQQDKPLTTISKWFQSHNYVAPRHDGLTSAAAPLGAASSAAAAAAAAAAAGLAAEAAAQQQQQLDLGSITQQQYRMLEQSVKQ